VALPGGISKVAIIAIGGGWSAPRGKGNEQGVDVLFDAEGMLLDEGVLPASYLEGLKTSNLPLVPPVEENS